MLYGQRVYIQTWMAESRKPAFDWDGANMAHIARHAVTPAEAEEEVSGASLPLETEERAGEERHAEVVTAFPANRKWRALWRRLMEGETDA